MIDKILMYSTLAVAVISLIASMVILIDLVFYDEALVRKVRSKARKR